LGIQGGSAIAGGGALTIYGNVYVIDSTGSPALITGTNLVTGLSPREINMAQGTTLDFDATSDLVLGGDITALIRGAVNLGMVDGGNNFSSIGAGSLTFGGPVGSSTPLASLTIGNTGGT